MIYKISDICDLNYSSITSKDKYETILYLDTSSITNNKIELLQTLCMKEAPSRAKRKVNSNTIIYSTVRPNLKHFGILKNPAENLIVSTGFTTIDIKENFKEYIDAEYLYLLLANQSVVDYLSTMAESAVSAYPSINPDDIGDLSFNFPDIDLQKKIAETIFPLENKISLNTHINAELEAMAKQLYDYWFVQFEFPDENGKPYKSSGGKMVYSEKLKREIPEGWEVKRLTDVLEEDVSGDWGQDEENGNYNLKVNCIRGADLKDPYNAPLRFINGNNKNRILKQGNIIVEISGGSPVQATGRSLYVTKGLLERYNGSLICSNFCRALVLKDVLMSHYFYYTWNLLYENGVMFNFEGKTSGIKNLLLDMFVGNSWYFPPQYLYKTHATVIEELNNRIDSNKINNQELIHLRDSLLPMLMNGQVTVE